MDFLKWILQACLMIALMFLGMKPDQDNQDTIAQATPTPHSLSVFG